MTRDGYDALVVGSGPNGLAAAIELARAGMRVRVVEGADQPGGGLRTAEATLPGFLHDICATAHPLAMRSPFFQELGDELGVTWEQPPAAVAHPFDDGPAIVVERDVAATAAQLGIDGAAWTRTYGPLVAAADNLIPDLLGPLRPPTRPLALARFGADALLPAATLATARFREQRTRALFAGMAGHAILPLERAGSAAVGLVLGMLAHAAGWPVARGGSAAIARGLVAALERRGGVVETGRWIAGPADIAGYERVIFDTGPQAMARIAGDELPAWFHQRLGRFRYGPGSFKIDWALDGPVPWRDPAVGRAATVHLGGSLAEIAAAERAAWSGDTCERPFVLLSQATLFDPTRAPAGKHTLWGYCHVPAASSVDYTERIERQIERFAPGFRERILARTVMGPQDYAVYNPNYVGGDINGGAQDLLQLFTRPWPSLTPYRTPSPRLYLGSSSTPPGGGVHGMCGWHAARAALRGRS